MTQPAIDEAIQNLETFRNAVSQFQELVVQNKPIFLVGAGCSKCAGLPLADELTSLIFQSELLDEDDKAILSTVIEYFGKNSSAQIEDYLSELIDLLAITNRREERNASNTNVKIGLNEYGADEVRNTVEHIKEAIADTIEKNRVSIETHREFISAVHRPRRVGKDVEPGTSVDYLVLNYDTVIEDALALAKIPYSDGIDGGVTGWWNPRTFDREGLQARVYKLHGSINWRELDSDLLPFRINSSLELHWSEQRKVLIWPSSLKYRETQLEPFAQLVDRARIVMRPSQNHQRVLVVCGYSFRDAHVNSEIENALRQSLGNLTAVIFTDQDTLTDPLLSWYNDATLRNHVLIFSKRGFYHGETHESFEKDLPWWKFETVTQILKGEV